MLWARAATDESGFRARQDVRRFEVFSWSPRWLAIGTHRRGIPPLRVGSIDSVIHDRCPVTPL